jgi:hypothetical protein
MTGLSDVEHCLTAASARGSKWLEERPLRKSLHRQARPAEVSGRSHQRQMTGACVDALENYSFMAGRTRR